MRVAQRFELELELIQPIWLRSQCCELKWGARVLRVRSVSREERSELELELIQSHMAQIAPLVQGGVENIGIV